MSALSDRLPITFSLRQTVAPLFAPLCAPRAARLTSFCTPRASFLTPFCAARASFLTPFRTEFGVSVEGVAGVVGRLGASI